MAVETSEGFCRHSSFQPPVPCFSPPGRHFVLKGSQLEPSPIPSSQPNPVLEPQDFRIKGQRQQTIRNFLSSAISSFSVISQHSSPAFQNLLFAHCHQPLNLLLRGSTSSGIHTTIALKPPSARSPHPSNDWQPYNSIALTTGIFNVRLPQCHSSSSFVAVEENVCFIADINLPSLEHPQKIPLSTAHVRQLTRSFRPCIRSCCLFEQEYKYNF